MYVPETFTIDVSHVRARIDHQYRPNHGRPDITVCVVDVPEGFRVVFFRGAVPTSGVVEFEVVDREWAHTVPMYGDALDLAVSWAQFCPG